ncbi:MAG: hypothetical protein R2941_19100 [Desulfobacterales bacterium]
MEMLHNFGQELGRQVSSFDIEKINLTLDAYPELVKNIRALCK